MTDAALDSSRTPSPVKGTPKPGAPTSLNSVLQGIGAVTLKRTEGPRSPDGRGKVVDDRDRADHRPSLPAISTKPKLELSDQRQRRPTAPTGSLAAILNVKLKKTAGPKTMSHTKTGATPKSNNDAAEAIRRDFRESVDAAINGKPGGPYCQGAPGASGASPPRRGTIGPPTRPKPKGPPGPPTMPKRAASGPARSGSGAPPPAASTKKALVIPPRGAVTYKKKTALASAAPRAASGAPLPPPPPPPTTTVQQPSTVAELPPPPPLVDDGAGDLFCASPTIELPSHLYDVTHTVALIPPPPSHEEDQFFETVEAPTAFMFPGPGAFDSDPGNVGDLPPPPDMSLPSPTAFALDLPPPPSPGMLADWDSLPPPPPTPPAASGRVLTKVAPTPPAAKPVPANAAPPPPPAAAPKLPPATKPPRSAAHMSKLDCMKTLKAHKVPFADARTIELLHALVEKHDLASEPKATAKKISPSGPPPPPPPSASLGPLGTFGFGGQPEGALQLDPTPAAPGGRKRRSIMQNGVNGDVVPGSTGGGGSARSAVTSVQSTFSSVVSTSDSEDSEDETGSECETPTPTPTESESESRGPRRAPPPPPAAAAGGDSSDPTAAKRMAICAFKFEARNQDELSFDRGDKVELIETPTAGGWWKAQLADDVGWFPCNHVRELIAPMGLKKRTDGPSLDSRKLVRSKSLSGALARAAGLGGAAGPSSPAKTSGGGALGAPIRRSKSTKDLSGMAPVSGILRSRSIENVRAESFVLPNAWTVTQVSSWLEGLGFPEYVEQFHENEIEGKHLLDLEKDDLKELGVTILGHRMSLAKAIAKLRAQIKEN